MSPARPLVKLEVSYQDQLIQQRLSEIRSALGGKIARKILTKTLLALSKDLKQQTRAAPIPPSVAKRAAATIAYSMKKPRPPRVGYSVGKQRARPHTGPGVGLSKVNIHWAVLGTQERRTRRGRSTGRMSAFLRGVASQVRTRAFSKFQRIADDILREEIAKKGG